MAPSAVNGVNGHAVANGSTLNGDAANGHPLNGASTNGHDGPDGAQANGSSGVGHVGQLPIAICGMACRLPGGLTTPQELWEFLLAKKSARCRVPDSRYNISSYYSAVPKPGTISTEYGYFLDESVDLGALDTSFFTLPRTEVERADPQQRLMLEVARECFEDAGVTNWRGKTIGCYIGNFGEDWVDMFAKETQQWGMHRIVGTGDFVISNRLSYEFDIKGPSMTIRTGCSAALVCLNEACAAISRGDCEAALVGGVNLILAPNMTTAMTEQGILSKDGACKSFSAEANGYARGEAVTAIFVKPLADALRDGNPVRAVIRATSHNADGKTPGLSQPSPDAQEALIRRAYRLAGIDDYAQTAMVECHGTGTATGDPIEAKAVARVFGDKGVFIGSVKPNMGHTEGASGLVSLIKMVMALEHRTIPPNIGFMTPNPNIPFAAAKLTVPLEPTPWPEDRLERISLNSFGVGGANAHAILESAASHQASAPAGGAPETPQLLLYTANSAKSLARLVARYGEWVDKNPDRVGDLAYTLALRREHLPHRAFAIAQGGVVESVSPPVHVKSAQRPGVVMVFTGQGAQWPQMGRELLQSNEAFRASIRGLDRLLQGTAGYSIEEELGKPARKSRLSSAELSQPLCTAVQIALVDSLRALGVVPGAVVGHSSGEIAAAYASGALTALEAITAAHHRGAATTRQTRAGAMAALGMGWAEAERYVTGVPGVTLACDNSPKSVTVSGDVDAVKALVASVKRDSPDVLSRLLQVDKAYHSYHMAEVGDGYRAAIRDVVGAEPSTPFFSSVTGKLLGRERALDARYWQDNLESPVRFREAVTALLRHEAGNKAVFLEIGPHSALAGPLRQILTEASSPAPYVAAMTRGQNCVSSLLAAVGKLHSLNVPVRLEALFPTGSCLPDLPRYPWNHEESFWYEPRLCREWRQRKHPYHDLLGVKLPESTDLEPAWRNLFHLANAPWIRDHRVGDDTIFPFAGYLALAGEAARQLTDADAGFSVRNIVVHTALVLTEGKPTEMVTTFRPRRLTTSLNSPWWEFTVAAHNGHGWTKHCTGEVSALTSGPEPGEAPGPLPRKIQARRWYETMRKGGLDLGPSFQTLDGIQTSTGGDGRAVASVINGRQGDEARYHIHPTVLDGTIQLLGAAAVRGHARKTRNWLPTSMDSFSVWRCGDDMVASVAARLSSNQTVVGDGRCTSASRTVVEASGIKMSLADGALTSDGADTHAAARLEWAPDADFLDVRDLLRAPEGRADSLRLLEELGQLCLLSSKRRCAGCEAGSEALPPHLRRYAAWLVAQARPAVSSLASVLKSLDNETVSARIHDMVARLADSPAPAARAIHQVCINMDLLLSGQGTLVDVLPDGTLSGLYDFVEEADQSRFLRSLAHSKPNLRVLEIGTGRGSLARDILAGLTRADGQVLCSKYTLTSPGFVSAKDQEKLFANMEFLTLDVSQDPSEQGFDDRQYDLIVAVGTLHGTKNIQESLANVKKLLHPDGRLLLRELCPSSKWVNYVLGVQPAWWPATTDGRDEEPYFSVEGWKSELAAAGFGAVDGVVLDAEAPHQLTATMVVRHASFARADAKNITLLCDGQGPAVDKVERQLEKEGYQVTKCKLDEAPPAGQDVVCLLDAESPFLENIDEARFHALQAFLGSLRDGGIFWATHLSELGCRDPRYAQVFGFARVVRSEMLADFATCEVDSFDDDESLAKMIQVLAKFGARQGSDTLNPDSEWAICNGQVHVGRFYPFSLPEELLVSEADDKAILNVGTPGRINSLHWERQPREALGAHEVEVQVHSAGLNFRDILVALGIVELPVRQFGLEAAGIITGVGPGVDPAELKVGDRVFCLKKQAFSTYITTPTTFCTRIPDQLSFDEAASMLMPYVTAIHGLVNVGRLVRGQSVLIHSACGGVGLAAVQIALMLEVDVYATVGNDNKAQFLMDTFGLPRHRIFNSRDMSFVDGVMRETAGQGVDVILNSLSGELLHATWTCVAEFGTLVEIGKRDLLGGGKLDMRPFLANRSYCCIDIDQLWKKPLLLRNLILSTLQYYVDGHTTPIRPAKIFPAAQTQDAFRYMQKGQHIGRVGISIPHPEGAPGPALESVPRARPICFDGAAAYLLVGGLGGLGRAVATWMVDHGARELLFLSRSAGRGTRDDAFAAELQSMGCDVRLVPGDVARLDDVARALAAATRPLRGVLQMSMVIRDQNFASMTFDEWTAATAPKVQGTWNLHHATASAGAELDFFVLFSSLSGIIGQPGQANYASGNTFLDAFAQYRNGLGLAASVVDIGAVEDIGFISEHQGLLGKMKTTGFKGLSEQELLDALAVATMTPPPAAAPAGTSRSRFVNPTSFVLGLGSAMPPSSPSSRAVWRKDRRMAAYHNVSAGGAAAAAASTETLKTYLAAARADPSQLKTPEAAALLAVEIGRKLFDLLLKPQEELNTALPLVDLGLDSLVALELRAWWKQVFGFDISVLEMLGMGSLDALGKHAADELLRVTTESSDGSAS